MPTFSFQKWRFFLLPDRISLRCSRPTEVFPRSERVAGRRCIFAHTCCDHHLAQDDEFSIHHCRNFLSALQSVTITFQVTTSLTSTTIDEFCLFLNVTQTEPYMSFCLLLLSHAIVFLRVTHIVPCTKSSFLFTAEEQFINKYTT